MWRYMGRGIFIPSSEISNVNIGAGLVRGRVGQHTAGGLTPSSRSVIGQMKFPSSYSSSAQKTA